MQSPLQYVIIARKISNFRAFIFLGQRVLLVDIYWLIIVGYVPMALLLIVIGLIVSYESFVLLKGSRIKRKDG